MYRFYNTHKEIPPRSPNLELFDETISFVHSYYRLEIPHEFCHSII